MKKRAKLSDRDPVLAVLRGSEPASQDTGNSDSKTPSRKASKTTKQQPTSEDSKPVKQQARKPAGGASSSKASKAAKRPTATSAKKQPSSQDASKTASREDADRAAKTPSQDASKAAPPTATQDASKTASREDADQAADLFDRYLQREEGEPSAAQREGQKAERIKATFYLGSEDLEILELEKLRRRRAGARRQGVADLSALVREAIRKAYGKR